MGVAPDFLLDGEGHLERLYASLKVPPVKRKASDRVAFPHYDTYRLRLPLQAMSTIEQIVICKFMLYSYIYHHAKVRAAEGLLAKMLARASEHWRQSGSEDIDILGRFMEMTDSALDGTDLRKSKDPEVSYYCEKVRARLLPREVFGFVSSMFSHAQGEMLANFISVLLDPARRGSTISEFEKALGEELLKIEPKLGSTPAEATWKAGAWLDVPSPPKFENIHLLIGHPNKSQPFSEVFPIEYWIQAYESHRYEVRIFAFSEYFEITKEAARNACKRVLGIHSDSFYDAAQKVRSSG